MNAGTPHTPLAGLRVLEFGHIAAVPFCGMLLADLGADVVRVDRPTGPGLSLTPYDQDTLAAILADV